MTRAQYFAEDTKGQIFIESLIRYGNRLKTENSTAQQSLFGESDGFEVVKPLAPEAREWPKLERLNREKDVVGIFLSAHPLDDFRLEMNAFCNISISELQDLNSLLNKEITIAGMVTDARSGTAKNGKPFGSFTLQDYTDSHRFMLFDTDYVDNSKYCTPGYFLMVRGKVQKRRFKDDELEVKITKIDLLTSVREELIHSLSLIIPLELITESFINNLKQHAEKNKGKKELKFLIADAGNKVSISLFSRAFTIDISNNFIKYLESVPGLEYKVN
jgi:DNA polymerase-3 subunit alpha